MLKKFMERRAVARAGRAINSLYTWVPGPRV